ncbi:MAG TPA: NUDIX domain-containing protein [Hyphomicrobium sp.]|nr:NUDIX domain-containing protein [Hyphomicrobium sp.]
MPLSKLVTRGLQRYWRVSRGLTLGAQGCVIDANNRVLLIRHTYRPGWHFPGGGVEKGETIEFALQRELEEEAGIVIDGRPRLFGLYANNDLFPGDHIALFVVRSWRQPHIPKPNHEIAEQGFFGLGDLPGDVNAATHTRIKEVLYATPPAQTW